MANRKTNGLNKILCDKALQPLKNGVINHVDMSTAATIQLFEKLNNRHADSLFRITLANKYPEQPMLTYDDVSLYLGISTDTLKHWVLQGKVKTIKALSVREPRITMKDLLDLFH